MEPTIKLKQAIKDYKSGKSQAFDVLYHESEKYIYTCIYKVMCGNDNAHDATQEIMQDTYLEIYKSISQLENEERFLQWAGMIATRKCYAYIKKNKKYVLVDEEDNTFDTLADNDNIIPESIIQDKEKQRLIREIVEKELTEMQKLCVIAFYYNGQKQSEIAQELGIPENTVKTNLSRAKGKIEKGILGVEKRDGIRLHSVAPILLLFFTEDVQAAEVPQEITRNVLSSVSGLAGTTGGTTAGAATATGVKGAVGKAAAASLKAKILGGLVGLGAIGAIGGAAYMAYEAYEVLTWESEYKEYLLDYDDATGFDLNDFDGDGIPELLVRVENSDTEVYCINNQEVKLVGRIQGQMYSNLENAVETWDDCRLGYGMNYDELIKLDYGTGVYNDTGREYKVADYAFYRYVEGEILNVSSNMDVLEKEFNTILFSDIEEAEIDERFEEFKKYGNRNRMMNTDEKNEEVAEEVGETENITQEEELELSEAEQENLRILAQFFTATRWGEDLAGVEIVPTEQNVCDFIGRVANENFEYNQWAYDKYLPTRIAEEEFRQVYTDDSIKEYVKSVFGVELSSINSFMFREENGNYVTLEAQSSSVDKCEIIKVVKEGDVYIVTGSHAFGYYEEVESQEPTYMQTYTFTMTLTESADSPFGYTLNSIKYEQREDVEAEETNKLKEILLYPEQYIEYYGDGVDISDVWFAAADIDKDGQNEIFLAKCYGKTQFAIIYNILKYDRDSNVVTDMDGDKTYEPIGTGQHLYETGILRTCTETTTNNTYFWNLLTGEFWYGPQYKPVDDTVAYAYSDVYAELTCPDGSIVTGEEGAELYESLMAGEEIPLEWYEATEENVNRILQ